MTQIEIFGGKTYDPVIDYRRLKTQLERVKILLLQGDWWAPYELASLVGGSESGVTARIRDLKKMQFGSYRILKRRREKSLGTWEYKLDRGN